MSAHSDKYGFPSSLLKLFYVSLDESLFHLKVQLVTNLLYNGINCIIQVYTMTANDNISRTHTYSGGWYVTDFLMCVCVCVCVCVVASLHVRMSCSSWSCWASLAATSSTGRSFSGSVAAGDSVSGWTTAVTGVSLCSSWQSLHSSRDKMHTQTQ